MWFAPARRRRGFNLATSLRILRLTTAAGLLLATAAEASETATNEGSKNGESAAPLDYSRQIRPILSNNCFKCHGPDEKERKGGLRLDNRDDALKPAESGAAAIVPGKPGESRLVERITAT